MDPTRRFNDGVNAGNTEPQSSESLFSRSDYGDIFIPTPCPKDNHPHPLCFSSGTSLPSISSPATEKLYLNAKGIWERADGSYTTLHAEINEYEGLLPTLPTESDKASYPAEHGSVATTGSSLVRYTLLSDESVNQLRTAIREEVTAAVQLQMLQFKKDILADFYTKLGILTKAPQQRRRNNQKSQ
jgi:hypothetical protein